MNDDQVKARLRQDLAFARDAVLAKLDGLSEYDVRRPLAPTGTNLLGLVKHLATWESRYLGDVFDRPFPEPLPRWNDRAARGTDMWATEHESRADVLGRFGRVTLHSDATIEALPLYAPGHVEWWATPEVTLYAVLVHLVGETYRHAGHADILREQLDGVVGTSGATSATVADELEFWSTRWAEVDRVARLVGSRDD